MKEINLLGFTEQAVMAIGSCIKNNNSHFAKAAKHFGTIIEEDGEIIYETPSLGFSIVANLESIVLRIYLDISAGKGLTGFPLNYRGLNIKSDQNAVRKEFGEPQKTGAESTGILGKRGCWDYFKIEGVGFHFEYLIDSKYISKITIGLSGEFCFQ
jgi:hypothetical protein